jgi:hypothetical protein
VTAERAMRYRALSLYQAYSCELALTGRCRCRCQGKLHGAARVDNPRALPVDDPHFPADAPLLLLAPLVGTELGRRE